VRGARGNSRPYRDPKFLGETPCVDESTQREYALANKGHDTRALQAYLGHRNIQHTVR